MRTGSVPLLFLAVGVAYWQYGGGLALMPALTADYFGANDLGIKYGLVFLGWGHCLSDPTVRWVYPRFDRHTPIMPFNLSGILMLSAVLLSLGVRRPVRAQ